MYAKKGVRQHRHIKNCESKSIFEIARDLKDLVLRSREGKITTDDITGGTITLSNVGKYSLPLFFEVSLLG